MNLQLQKITDSQVSHPEGMTPPDGSNPPGGMTPPDGSNPPEKPQ